VRAGLPALRLRTAPGCLRDADARRGRRAAAEDNAPPLAIGSAIARGVSHVEHRDLHQRTLARYELAVIVIVALVGTG